MELHLGLMRGFSWVLQMAPLMVLMKANLRVTCLGLDLDKKLVLDLVLLTVPWMDLMMACRNEQLLDSHLVHLLDLCLTVTKASY